MEPRKRDGNRCQSSRAFGKMKQIEWLEAHGLRTLQRGGVAAHNAETRDNLVGEIRCVERGVGIDLYYLL